MHAEGGKFNVVDFKISNCRFNILLMKFSITVKENFGNCSNAILFDSVDYVAECMDTSLTQ